ncbi:uncharacterized protein LOC117315360 isoform X2 [Pecten maximus]|uniref:uncharacterized protein LOC117315360 isoform X2 n=1 Tax=Pecten maximus TaxID=6579 RepID=UPI0014580CB4|nr:uncharacterized protein LOC117315360 isoform X2 [Pecten maximus]
MEEIIIPDVEKITRVVAKTIDRFTNLAEAISVTEEGRSCTQNVSKLSVCRTIMMELNSTKTDYDGLFDVLENVILTLVADGFSGCCQTKQTKLPNLTAMQKQALRKTVTFDELLIKELISQENNLRKLVKKHKKIMADTEMYKRASAKHQNKLAAILYRLHESGPMKKRLLFFLQMKRNRIQKELVRTKSACRTIADLERDTRSQIQKVSRSIIRVVSDKICGRLQYGIESYLYEVISKMHEHEK